MPQGRMAGSGLHFCSSRAGEMKEMSREMGSSRRTAEEIFRDYSGRRTDAVHDLTNEREVEQGFVHFGQLGLPPTFGKDVSFIQHEPLLEQLREIRAYERKVKRADAKKNKERAALLKERRPPYKLDRIILQRYPKFVDALRDIDDCLSY